MVTQLSHTAAFMPNRSTTTQHSLPELECNIYMRFILYYIYVHIIYMICNIFSMFFVVKSKERFLASIEEYLEFD